MLTSNAALQSASSALVIGGGITGVELAAELCVAYPALSVTLVHGGSELLSTLVKRVVPVANGAKEASRYTEDFLLDRGVHLVHNRMVIDYNADTARWRLDNGEEITADVAYFCASTVCLSSL